MSIKMHKALAVLLMLLAIGWVAGSIQATTRSGQIQGPSALAVLPDESVWLSVDKELWHLDQSGHRIARVTSDAAGMSGRIGNLMLHPNGQLIAQVRGDPTLYFLDAQTGAVQAGLVPKWQADLQQHGSDAINYAFHDDWRVAIATGGGHAVALFDPQGNFLARTRPGLYRFTNGLWWAGDTLWTTDTNGQELVELDGATLAEKSRVALSRSCGGFAFLGFAEPSRGKPDEATQTAPLATLVRFANGMIKGRASDIFPDGHQMDFPFSETLEPRDIKWRANELLLVDGASFAIKRYSAERMPLEDFGDLQVQADLTGALSLRNNLESRHKLYLGGALLFFVIGFWFALRAHLLEKKQALATLKMDLSQLGTPVLSNRAQFIAAMKLVWPSLLVVGATVFALLKLPRLVPQEDLLLLLFGLVLLLLLLVIALKRNLKSKASLPETEAVFNLRATQFLRADVGFWQGCRPAELPQETTMLAIKGGLHWLVLTNQRFLLYVANARDKKLVHEYSLSELRGARILGKVELSRWQKLQHLLNVTGGTIRFDFGDGTVITGFAVSGLTARRIAARLQESLADMPSKETSRTVSRLPEAAVADLERKARAQVIASLLIPGLGQWMQRRSGTALMLFLLWTIVAWDAARVGWTLWNSRAEVALWYISGVTGIYLFMCVLAAWETWRMRERHQNS